MKMGFEDHCWADLVPDEILKVYEPYHREVYVSERAALLAIDLYNLVYRGGAKAPHELVEEYPSTCGRYAWDAIEPTKQLFAVAKCWDTYSLYYSADNFGCCSDKSPGRSW